MNNETTDSGSPPGDAPGSRRAPPVWQVLAAFAAIYLIWSSTYLAIRFGVESIPPFLMAGSRFVAAGALLYGVARLRGAARPTPGQWGDAAVAGSLMLTIGNGGVTWAELVIPSGVTALLVAVVPVWMVLLDWLRPNGVRPRPLVLTGLAVGLLGVALLARNNMRGAGPAYGWGVVSLMAASIGWAVGSIYYRQSRKPGSPVLAIALQMIVGGVLLLGIALLHGEAAKFSFRGITAASAGAWLYLTIFGSLVGFTAYVWLLRVSTPARVSTYAYINPLIAVVLGCTLGREAISAGSFVAGGLIVVAVVLIVRNSHPAPAPNGSRAPAESRTALASGSR